VKVYVASKFENTKAVREAYEALKQDGHTITHDWTGENADGLSGDYLRSCAEKDVSGVAKGQGFLMLNHERIAGGNTELGIAIALKKFIVVIDGKHPDKPSNIFFNLPDVHHAANIAQARTLFNVHQMWLDEMGSAS
jgi:superfamily I DNA and RNA helicase